MTTPNAANVSPPIWEVSGTWIHRLTDEDLNALMRRLLLAEAYTSGCNVAEVIVNQQIKAKDGGCDAMSPAPKLPNPWLGDSETCWQFKAGQAGEPKKLEGEVTKDEPVKILKAGGGFAVVASGSVAGVSGRDARLKTLTSEAVREGLPIEKIRVLTCESLTTWINSNPGVAAGITGLTGDRSMHLAQWRSHEQFTGQWFPDEKLKRLLDELTQELDFFKGTKVHAHIFGNPGVGKTRFTLEVCQASSFGSLVLYAPQGSDPNLTNLLGHAANSDKGNLVLVVDETTPEQVEHLVFQAKRASDKVRLITIGHERCSGVQGNVQVEITPLDTSSMDLVIENLHSHMPPDIRRAVIRISDGYIKLARLLAEAVNEDANLSVAGLLEKHEIQRLLDLMLGHQNDRMILYVPALLTSVGWSGKYEDEGKEIAAFLNLSWPEVQAKIYAMNKRLGIIQQKADFRYISPEPLALYLAHEALSAIPGLLNFLKAKFTDDDSRNRLDNRLKALSNNPIAKAFS